MTTRYAVKDAYEFWLSFTGERSHQVSRDDSTDADTFDTKAEALLAADTAGEKQATVEAVD